MYRCNLDGYFLCFMCMLSFLPFLVIFRGVDLTSYDVCHFFDNFYLNKVDSATSSFIASTLSVMISGTHNLGRVFDFHRLPLGSQS